MQVEKISSPISPKPCFYKPFCTNRINIAHKFSNDSVSFGHSIIMPDTQKVIANLISKLSKLGHPLKINDNTLGELSATINVRKGSNVWDLIVSSSRGKGKNKEFNTYYYGEGGNKIAKETRIGGSSRFLDADKLDEMGRFEWNDSVLQVANVLFRHLPQ